jgi:RNA polymerase sigma-70 factor (ECF subfamily)
VRNKHDVDDVMQEALLNAFSHLASFRREARLGSWLVSILINQSVQYYRRSYRWRELSPIEADGAPLVQDSMPSPFEQLEKLEACRMLSESIDSLPIEYRVLVQLFHIEGLSVLKAAQQVGISEGAAKSRLLRARARLAKLLAGRVRVN